MSGTQPAPQTSGGDNPHGSPARRCKPSLPAPKLTISVVDRIGLQPLGKPAATVAVTGVGTQQTGRSGEVTFKDVTANTEYSVTVTCDGYRTRTAKAHVGLGETRKVIGLSPMGLLALLFRDKDADKPLSGVQVKVRPRGTELAPAPAEQTTRSEGRLDWSEVDFGSYTLDAQKAGYLPINRTVVHDRDGLPPHTFELLRVKPEIRWRKNAGAPPRYLLVGQVIELLGNAASAFVKGSFDWSVEGAAASVQPAARQDNVSNVGNKYIDLAAGNKPSNAVGGDAVKMKFTPEGGTEGIPANDYRFTVIEQKICAEDGESEPPLDILPGQKIRLTAVVKPGVPGSYKWTSKSERLKLSAAALPWVEVERGKGYSDTEGAEELECVFTPNDGPAFPAMQVKLTVRGIRIRAADGTSRALRIVERNRSIQLKAIVTPPKEGTFAWTTDSTLATLEQANTDMVTVKGGKTLSKKQGDVVLKVTFTPNGADAWVPGSVKVTVGAIDIRREDGRLPLPANCVFKETRKLKGMTWPAMTGTFKWSTKSALLTLADASKQIVQVTAGTTTSSTADGEEIELIFEPKGQGPMAPKTAKIPVVPYAIRAEDGIADPPKTVAVDRTLRLKAVHSADLVGVYAWSSASAKLTLRDTAKQLVAVVASKNPSAAPEAETIQLTFTPTGQAALPAVQHKIGVGAVLFSAEPSHSWGFDKYERLSYVDKNGNATNDFHDPKYDILSIKKSALGKVKIDVQGCTPKEVFFVSTKQNRCQPKVAQPTAASEVLEIQAGAFDKDDTALIEARLGSATGALLGQLGICVLKEITYQIEYFRVHDSTNAATLPQENITAAQMRTRFNEIYKPGVARWTIAGGDLKDVAYDLIPNGKLDLEPGTDSEEWAKIKAACTTAKPSVVYVRDLRWSFYLAANCAATDTKIKIKDYGGSLAYIGAKSYDIEDSDGNKRTITVKPNGMNTSTGEAELTGAVGFAFQTAKKAALIWPLAGLSGHVAVIKDLGSADLVKQVAMHEMGHTCCEFKDICAQDCLMFAISGMRFNIRNRPITQYYHAPTTEQQWLLMKGRT